MVSWMMLLWQHVFFLVSRNWHIFWTHHFYCSTLLYLLSLLLASLVYLGDLHYYCHLLSSQTLIWTIYISIFLVCMDYPCPDQTWFWIKLNKSQIVLVNGCFNIQKYTLITTQWSPVGKRSYNISCHRWAKNTFKFGHREISGPFYILINIDSRLYIIGACSCGFILVLEYW